MITAVVVVSSLGAPSAFANPRLSIVEARKVALARVPGKIADEKLKKKKGHEIYSFKIVPQKNAKPHFLEKVSIDGDTGKILKIKEVTDKTGTVKKAPKSDDDE